MAGVSFRLLMTCELGLRTSNSNTDCKVFRILIYPVDDRCRRHLWIVSVDKRYEILEQVTRDIH